MGETNGIDPINERLLQELQADARISLAELGRTGRAVGAGGCRAPPATRGGGRDPRLQRGHGPARPRLLAERGAAHPAGTPAAAEGGRACPQRTPQIVECHRVTGEDCFYMRLHVHSIEELEQLIDSFPRLRHHHDLDRAVLARARGRCRSSLRPRELEAPPEGSKPSSRVQLLGPVVVVRHEEGQLVAGLERCRQRGLHHRAAVALPAVPAERHHVVDLADAVLLGRACTRRRPAVGHHRERPRVHHARHQLEMRHHLPRRVLCMSVTNASSREGRSCAISTSATSCAGRPAPARRGPCRAGRCGGSAAAEVELEPPASALVRNHDLAVAERRRALEPFGVRHELLGAQLVEAALHAQEVLVIDAREVGPEERGAELERLDSLRAAVLQRGLEAPRGVQWGHGEGA